MLSHLAFMCTKEERPCPLYAVGCTDVHSLADADSSHYLEHFLEAHVSGAYGTSFHNNDFHVTCSICHGMSSMTHHIRACVPHAACYLLSGQAHGD